MKKMISLLLLTAFLQQASGQSETFSIATFTAPKDWKKDGNAGVVTYTSMNTGTGAFCILAMYEADVSLGDAQKDFTREWQDRAMTPHNAGANPKTELQTTADGWKVMSGAAPIKIQDLDAYAILAVFSGFGKKFSVLTILNDQSYTEGVDSFLKDIQLNKTASVKTTATTTPDLTKANQANGKFGSLLYTTPKGWNVTKYPDGDILTPADLPKGEFLEVWVQPSMSFSGTIEQALQQCYDETVQKMQATTMRDVNGGNYAKEAAKISFRGWEYIRGSGGIHMGAGEYPPEYGLDLFVIKINGRFEKVSIIKSRNNCSYSRYYPSNRVNYNNDIGQFLFSLQFPDWKEPVVKTGIANGDGITAAWQGIAMSVGTPKPGAELGASLKGKQLIFFTNGQAFFGNNFPVEGLDGMNTWVKAEEHRRDWGTFSFVNGKGVLKLPYADIPLRMDNGKLIITTNNTDHAFIKINTVDGARFNGIYALSSKTFLGEETGKTPQVRFSPDGQFSDNGALKILLHEPVECLNPAKDPGSGTYEVKNYSIIFNYTDGRKIKIAFMGTDYEKNNQSPATLTLSFNDDVLRKL